MCPNLGHVGSRVSRDGTYGKRKRQRFRCTLDDGTFHRFVPPLPRQVLADDFDVASSGSTSFLQGPQAMRRGLYQVREMAGALVGVANGVSYTEAARRVREDYWGETKSRGTRKRRTVEGGQTIADWLNLFGPVISEHYAETRWPETLVLDATEFKYTDPKTGDQAQLFVILAAWGYEAGKKTGRLWRVEARPRDQTSDWVEFLQALPGKPASVVYDGDLAIGPAIQKRWRGKVPAHLCEHHLHVNSKRALEIDVKAGYVLADPELLESAFHGPREWRAFKKAVRESRGPALAKWVAHWDGLVSAQVARRATMPAHYSTGPLDAALRSIRGSTESRKWTFRNRERMNQLLDLMRLRVNRDDDVDTWAGLIRDHLEATGGLPSRGRRLADPVLYDLEKNRVYSLRA